VIFKSVWVGSTAEAYPSGKAFIYFWAERHRRGRENQAERGRHHYLLVSQLTGVGGWCGPADRRGRKNERRGPPEIARVHALEVMISLAILHRLVRHRADLNGARCRWHAYARKASEASLLLSGKMSTSRGCCTRRVLRLRRREARDFDAESAPDYSGPRRI